MDAIRAEREQLDHQRVRIEQILAQDIVSPDMQEHLERLLGDLARRLERLPAPQGGMPAYASHPA